MIRRRCTPVALTDYAYVPTAATGALIAFLVKISEDGWNRAFVVLDAAALGFWAITGAQKTLAAGLGWLPALLLGTLSAVGGGALRDIVLGRVPAVFGGNAMYATVAAVSAGIMVDCSYAHQPFTGMVLGITVGLLFRLVALRRGWSLPNSPHWQPRSRLASYLGGKGFHLALKQHEHRTHHSTEDRGKAHGNS
ncbi:trimeric intracellular cation channel family protein [Streptomyces sp. cmx-18-6]|uniref:trimeric intracellular cation channel family protein n=1 Tax=Streptomyces sp. cmx-18-6 TaxID=2790930 RepID=UPI00397F199A